MSSEQRKHTHAIATITPNLASSPIPHYARQCFYYDIPSFSNEWPGVPTCLLLIGTFVTARLTYLQSPPIKIYEIRNNTRKQYFEKLRNIYDKVGVQLQKLGETACNINSNVVRTTDEALFRSFREVL